MKSFQNLRGWFIFTMMLSSSYASAAELPQEIDLILHSAKVLTMDPKHPEAEAIAIQGDIITAVGSNSEILSKATSQTKRIDGKGNLVLPGLIDSHAHFMSVGKQRLQVNLRKAGRWEDVIQAVANAAKGKPDGSWIIGRGWHQEKWKPAPSPQVGGFPVHDALSQATPNHPVMLIHASGHAIIANAKAMDLAGVTQKTPNPLGGEIIRDSKGRVIGVFTENAEELIDAAYQRYWKSLSSAQRESELIQQIQSANLECLENGITTVHDAGVDFDTLDLYRKLVDQDRIGVRLWVMINEGNEALSKRLSEYRWIGYHHHQLTVRAIKRLLDGALGSRSAWMLEPYADRPDNQGLNTIPLASLQETAQIALQKEFQLCVHAIGDRANREALNLFEKLPTFSERGKQLRWRIEHAQHLHPDDIPRFSKLGVIAAMQGVHATSDGSFIEKRLGVWRSQTGAYAWRSLLQTGAIISNGTDAPVEEIDPMACIYSSITRRQADGTPFFAQQAMTRLEALQSYTIHGAYAGFEEHIKGSLEVGKLADLIILSQDIMTVPEKEIPNTKVLMTMIGGKIPFSRR